MALTRAAGATLLALLAAGCGDGGNADGGVAPTDEKAGRIAVLLPDSRSSVRWETVDRPFLKAAFDEAGVESEIHNAEGDKFAQQQQAEDAVINGAKVLLLVNLDADSGAAITANVKSRGVKVIDYDRLTMNGDSDYYVSYDGEQIGRLQGRGLVACLEDERKPAVAVLNGAPSDVNATLFKRGYDSVINPKFASGQWTEVADRSVPGWDNRKAREIFEQLLQRADNKIDGVLAANDGLGNAVISALKGRQLAQIPVTGQDATLPGIQSIVAGDQCMTVYEAARKEADAAASLAIALAKGEAPTGVTESVNNGSRDVPAILIEPVAVTKDNIKQYIGEPDFPRQSEICAGELAARCKEIGLS